VRDIAEEKLAVLGTGSTLALGAELAPEALAVAERVARERGALMRSAPAAPACSRLRLAAKGEFQRRNFALAELAARSYLETIGLTPSEDAIRDAALATEIRGRLQVIAEEPLTVLDGAHNPDAVRALVRALPELVGEQPLALVLGVLEDKDAAAMLEALLPLCERAWFTAPPSERALSPGALQSLARQLGFERVSCEASPARALADAREWAREHGAAVLATGSVYLVGDLLERGELGAATQESAARRRRAAT